MSKKSVDLVVEDEQKKDGVQKRIRDDEEDSDMGSVYLRKGIMEMYSSTANEMMKEEVRTAINGFFDMPLSTEPRTYIPFKRDSTDFVKRCRNCHNYLRSIDWAKMKVDYDAKIIDLIECKAKLHGMLIQLSRHDDGKLSYSHNARAVIGVLGGSSDDVHIALGKSTSINDLCAAIKLTQTCIETINADIASSSSKKKHKPHGAYVYQEGLDDGEK